MVLVIRDTFIYNNYYVHDQKELITSNCLLAWISPNVEKAA